MSRYFGCESVMNLAEFCELRTPDIAWAAIRMSLNIYIEILERVLVKKEEELWGVDFVFQRGNANINSSADKKTWLRGKILESLGQDKQICLLAYLNFLCFGDLRC